MMFKNCKFLSIILLLLTCLMSRGLAATTANASNSRTDLQSLTIQTLKSGKVLLVFTFSQPLSQAPRDFTMTNPNRIVMDFLGVKNATGKTRQKLEVTPVGNAIFVATPDRLRVLLELSQSVQYAMRVEGNKVYLTLVTGYQSVKGVLPQVSLKNYKLEKIDFRVGKIKGSGQLILDLSHIAAKVDIIERSNTIELTLADTTLADKLKHRYDVTDYSTPVKFFDAMQVGDDTKISIVGAGKFTYTAYQVNKKFIVDVNPIDERDKDIGSSKQYTGELVSLDFQNIQVRAVLQLLAEFTGKNIIISNAVAGNITLRLKDIPWDQALDIILRTQGLDKREVGNIIMIGPAQEIAAVETQELQDKQKLAEVAPLYSEIFHINYGNAQAYYTMLKGNQETGAAGAVSTGSGVAGLMSSRGRVILDQRTNTLFIDDTSEHLDLVRKFLAEIDVPVKQVMIEARIVSVTKNFQRDLGINFGLKQSNNSGFNMDLGGGAVNSPGSNLNLQFSRLPANFLLDLELSALESENDADIISSPRVITANNMQATIEQGQQIPYNTQAASGGTTTQFITATLKLDVTPQITPDNKIILKLIVSHDTPNRAKDGTVTIDTKKVSTNILVDNGETIVLGGIYERNKTSGENRVPFLSSIPILGYLFKSQGVSDRRTELLVFVTPKIINPELTP